MDQQRRLVRTGRQTLAGAAVLRKGVSDGIVLRNTTSNLRPVPPLLMVAIMLLLSIV